MDEALKIAAQQAPSLCVLCFVVVVFVRALRGVHASFMDALHDLKVSLDKLRDKL